MTQRRRMHAGTLIAAGAAVAVSFGVAACGDSNLDTGDVEQIFQGQVEQVIEQAGSDATITSITCPDEIENENGTTFECTAEISDGSTVSNTGEVTDSEEGTVTFAGETLEGTP